jgi:prevent-host-death family protein
MESMLETTFTELRNHAKHYFDAVEEGDIVRVYRNGKPIADIVPVRQGIPSWKRPTTRFAFKNLVLGDEIIKDREETA